MSKATPVMDRLTAKSVEAPCLVKGLLPLCWVWTGSKNAQGYGIIKSGKNTGTHRVGYTELIGEIPSGLEPDHLCQRRDCWNPWHLDPVTHSMNVKRGRAGAVIRARAALIVQCPAGHPYTGDNDRRNSRGKRYCRQCGLDRDRQRREAAGAGLPNAVKTHCPYGHPYAPENTALVNGSRICRECNRLRLKRLRAEHPEKMAQYRATMKIKIRETAEHCLTEKTTSRQ